MMGEVFGTIEKLARSFQEGLSARTVYGEPIRANGVTLVPVARVRFGFGGGGGGGTGGGGGFGGGGIVQPIGYVEITESGSRWVPMERPQSDVILHALRSAARILPIAGRRGIFALLALLAAQALVGQLFRAREPSIAELVSAGLRVAGRG